MDFVAHISAGNFPQQSSQTGEENFCHYNLLTKFLSHRTAGTCRSKNGLQNWSVVNSAQILPTGLYLFLRTEETCFFFGDKKCVDGNFLISSVLRA